MKIQIGIVTFNNSQKQLFSLLQSISASFEIALKTLPIELSIAGIDNGEACFEQAIKSISLPSTIATTLLPTQGNIGFGRAMNMLMSQTFSAKNSDFFIAANPDGLFHRDCLKELLFAATTAGDALLEARQFPEEHPKPYSITSGDTPWATGACLAIPSKIYETIGGFDENLFMYGEDVDLSWRALAAGFAVKLVHKAIFIHPTLGRTWSKEAKKHLFLSSVYLAAKWKSQNFQEVYEAQFRSRFGESVEDSNLLNAAILAAQEASNDICNVCVFKPFFNDNQTFSDARWSY